jgi:hypothetical protein
MATPIEEAFVHASFSPFCFCVILSAHTIWQGHCLLQNYDKPRIQNVRIAVPAQNLFRAKISGKRCFVCYYCHIKSHSAPRLFLLNLFQLHFVRNTFVCNLITTPMFILLMHVFVISYLYIICKARGVF